MSTCAPPDGATPTSVPPDAPFVLATLRDIGIPNGLAAIGYAERDVPALIEGTLKQPRLLAGAPRAVGAAELEWILHDSMQYW